MHSFKSNSSKKNSSSKIEDILQKRIPINPRYSSIKAVVDTGASMSKYLNRIEEDKRNYRYKKGELFRRLKPFTFLQLFLEVVSEDYVDNEAPQTMEEKEISTTTEKKSNQCLPAKSGSIFESSFSENLIQRSKDRSTLCNLVHGIGDLDLDENTLSSRKVSSEEKKNEKQVPFLLLDVRDEEDFCNYHIFGSYNYPMRILSRSCNSFNELILQYKNASGRMIIVCDDDERFASVAAQTFFERGVDNIFMLSGGIKLFVEKFPDTLLVGVSPFVANLADLKASQKTNKVKKDALTRKNLLSNQFEARFEPPQKGASFSERSVSKQSSLMSGTFSSRGNYVLTHLEDLSEVSLDLIHRLSDFVQLELSKGPDRKFLSRTGRYSVESAAKGLKQSPLPRNLSSFDESLSVSEKSFSVGSTPQKNIAIWK